MKEVRFIHIVRCQRFRGLRLLSAHLTPKSQRKEKKPQYGAHKRMHCARWKHATHSWFQVVWQKLHSEWNNVVNLYIWQQVRFGDLLVSSLSFMFLILYGFNSGHLFSPAQKSHFSETKLKLTDGHPHKEMRSRILKCVFTGFKPKKFLF